MWVIILSIMVLFVTLAVLYVLGLCRSIEDRMDILEDSLRVIGPSTASRIEAQSTRVVIGDRWFPVDYEL